MFTLLSLFSLYSYIITSHKVPRIVTNSIIKWTSQDKTQLNLNATVNPSVSKVRHKKFSFI